MRLTISVRHNYDRGAREVAALNPRLKVALLEGTERATVVLRNAVVRSVLDRTTMNVGIAEAITDSEVVLGRGRVSFRPPPPGGWEIRPRRKKALYWPGARHPVARVQHPGARPYVLIGRSAVSSEALVNRQWADAVGRVL
jgi:hypothetical protein